MRNRILALACVILASLLNHRVGFAGTIYRCTGDHGEVAYRQHPCGSRSQTRIDAAHRDDTQSGLREGEKALLKHYERRQRGSAAVEGHVARPQNKARSAYACRQKKRALDAVSEKLRRGYKPASGEKLRRRRRAYQDYLSTFCS